LSTNWTSYLEYFITSQSQLHFCAAATLFSLSP
jgi:hypothetical protein